MAPESPRAELRILVLVATSVCIVLVAVWLARLLGIEEALIAVLQTVEGAGRVGQLSLMVLIVVVVIALLPGAPLTLGVGFLYGPLEGAAMVVVATTIGSTLAMLMGRYLLRRPVSLALNGRPRLAAALALPDANDWRFVALLRLIPLFPSPTASGIRDCRSIVCNSRGSAVALRRSFAQSPSASWPPSQARGAASAAGEPLGA